MHRVEMRCCSALSDAHSVAFLGPVVKPTTECVGRLIFETNHTIKEKIGVLTSQASVDQNEKMMMMMMILNHKKKSDHPVGIGKGIETCCERNHRHIGDIGTENTNETETKAKRKKKKRKEKEREKETKRKKRVSEC